MSSGNKPSLSLEVFDLDVKDHVSSDLLVSDWVRVSDLTNIERDSHVLNFFRDDVLPQCVPVFFIKPNGLFGCLWYLDPIFLFCLCYCLFIAAIICSLFFRVKSTHQAKAGLSSMPLALAYLATSTGLDSFMLASRSHDVESSFLCMQRCHPLVDFLRCFLPLS